MKKLLLPLLALAALALPARAAISNVETIAPGGFARGVVLTVAGYDANRTTLTDFPVLVRIAEYNATAGTGIQGFDYDDLMFKSTGDDICFVAEDGTPLAFAKTAMALPLMATGMLLPFVFFFVFAGPLALKKD